MKRITVVMLALFVIGITASLQSVSAIGGLTYVTRTVDQRTYDGFGYISSLSNIFADDGQSAIVYMEQYGLYWAVDQQFEFIHRWVYPDGNYARLFLDITYVSMSGTATVAIQVLNGGSWVTVGQANTPGLKAYDVRSYIGIDGYLKFRLYQNSTLGYCHLYIDHIYCKVSTSTGPIT